MPFPAEGLESAYRNHIDDVRSLLETRHGGRYAIYNVSGRSYSSAKFNARVTDCGWPAKHAPTLVTLYSLCQSMYDFLSMDPRNIAVVHCIVSPGNLEGRELKSIIMINFLQLISHLGWQILFCNSGLRLSLFCWSF